MVNTNNSKKVLFRLNADMKTDFSIALVKNGIGAQHVLESVVERVIAYNQDALQSKDRKFIDSLFSRAKELQAESKI